LNSNSIYKLEKKVNTIYLWPNTPLAVKRQVVSPYKNKIKKLAFIQVQLKKELKDIHEYTRLYEQL
jgi:hypothetical protein